MKTSMTMPRAAGRLHEEIIRRREMAQQVAVELGLAVLVEPEARCRARPRAFSAWRLEKRDEGRGVLRVDVEVRARETEDDRGLSSSQRTPRRGDV